MTFVLGLTGSIAMGKSTVARQLRGLGAASSDADGHVHRLMEPGGRGFRAIAEAFPQALKGGRIDRGKLGEIVFADTAALHRLEAILHPLVRKAHGHAIMRARYERRPLLVLEIPLLYETGGDHLCDAVAVVTAPRFLQHSRALARPGMDPLRLRRVLARQMPDHEKRRAADFVITTGLGRRHSLEQVAKVVRAIGKNRHCPPCAGNPGR